MQESKKNLLDRFVDEFSMVELKRRVTSVTLIGIILCIAVIVGAYFFLNTHFQVQAGGPQTPFWKLLWMGK